jgi:hypothetical protein
MTQPSLVDEALRRFDALNAEDPHQIEDNAAMRPRELVQAERLERWVLRLAPHASLPLRLAARCQHLQRWRIPRSNYPEGRIGYLKWRKDLGHFHAEETARVLRDVGFDDQVIEAVRSIVMKQGLKTHADTQVIEDALCLSFLEHEFAEFAAKHEESKVVDIVRKTWRKMSEAGRSFALQLSLPPSALRLVQRALSAPEAASEPETP